MVDWTASMQQTFEFYTVDPITWQDEKLLDTIKSASINRDLNADTLGSASIDATELVGECYIRIYLVIIQNGENYKYPLGTYLVQTPSSEFNGKIRSVSMDAYTPLLELQEDLPPLGYSIEKNENIMDMAYKLCVEHVRAPVIKPECTELLYNDFVANVDDTWMTFLKDFIENAKYEFSMDERGQIMFAPKQDIEAMQPIWTYNDDNSSILHADISVDHDLYGIPNVVEVVYSKDNEHYYAKAVNNDPNSLTSTVSRGRQIVTRINDPSIVGDPTNERLQEYAKKLLEELSSVEYTIQYTHGYCPVRVGDCIRLNYERAGLVNIKAKVISQSIECEPGCPVDETAVFTSKLWEG